MRIVINVIFYICAGVLGATGGLYVAYQFYPHAVYNLTKQCRPMVLVQDCQGHKKGTVYGEECFALWNRKRDGLGNDSFTTLPGMDRLASPDCRPAPSPHLPSQLGEGETLKRPN